MTATALPSAPWPRRRWITTISALLAAQLALILYFGERPHLLPRAVRPKTTMYLAVDELSAGQIADLPTVTDPALFALPSLQGFSGKSWLTFREPDYTVKGWSEAPSYLALDIGRLGETFSRFVGTNSPFTFGLASRQPPEFGTMQISVPPLPINSSSELRLDGPIQRLRLLNPLDIPSWPSDDVLANTVVQVIVDGVGNVISSTLLAFSGSVAADKYALQQASAARFEPATGPQRLSTSTFGRFIFQWHTTAPTQTNSLSPQP